MVCGYITGVMGSGKTQDLISTYEYYKGTENPWAVKTATHSITRTPGKISSRDGREVLTDYVLRGELDLCRLTGILQHCKVLLIDEAQFLTVEQLEKLHTTPCKIVLYGLDKDFNGKEFPAFSWVKECNILVKYIQEVPCAICQKYYASEHVCYIDGVPFIGSSEGEKIESEKLKYLSVCAECAKKERRKGKIYVENE